MLSDKIVGLLIANETVGAAFVQRDPRFNCLPETIGSWPVEETLPDFAGNAGSGYRRRPLRRGMSEEKIADGPNKEDGADAEREAPSLPEISICHNWRPASLNLPQSLSYILR